MSPKPRTTPRKQPQQERSRATIDAILTATARILVKHGFDRASTNRIADEAGVSIGSLYQYFPSKEALVAALVEDHTAQMTGEIVGALEEVSQLPLEAAVRAMVLLMLRAHAVDPALHKVLAEQVPRSGRLEQIHDVERQMMQLICAYFERHAGELRVKDFRMAAFVVVTCVEALTHAATIHHAEKLKERALADEITSLVVRYLAR